MSNDLIEDKKISINNEEGTISITARLEEVYVFNCFGHDLHTLLPRGYSFSPYTSMTCDHQRRLVGIDFTLLDTKDFPLVVLHEIGHANMDSIEEIEHERKIVLEMKQMQTPDIFMELAMTWVNIISSRECCAWIYALDQGRKILNNPEYDIGLSYTSIDIFLWSILGRFISYRDGLIYMIQRTRRLDVSQERLIGFYINDVFGRHQKEISHQARVFWNNFTKG